MSESFEGCFLHVDGDPTYWLIENGQRWRITSPEAMYAEGLRPTKCVLPDELTDIPVMTHRPPQHVTEATAVEPVTEPTDTTLAFGDGIDDTEASAAGKALNQRKKHGGQEKPA